MLPLPSPSSNRATTNSQTVSRSATATGSSAPEHSPPSLLGNKHSSAHDLRRDVVKTHTIVSEVQHDVADTHAMVSDLHRNMQESQGGSNGQHRSVSVHHTTCVIECSLTGCLDRKQASNFDYHSILCLNFVFSAPGEAPPRPPSVFFGRYELVEKVVDSAKNLTPIALIGTGGIGKTSIALTALYDNRIVERFGGNRRFIRCDKFPASLTHFLRRLSEVIGAGVENPEDLVPLRPFLSSREMFIILDNAESILDPEGANAQEIYGVVEELSSFSNISLCVTSRISTIPPNHETLEIPTLPKEAACDTFYHIYRHGCQSALVDDVLEQLDFHPLSITLLATVAIHSKWDTDRLAREWEKRRTGMLKTRHKTSLAAAIELSLDSPTFQELGPDARGLLGVVAFYPQGVDEKSIDWLFPTVSNITDILDTFCILSLTYRSDGFITMLAPLRDYFCPQNPMSSQLLCITKDIYFFRLVVTSNSTGPTFQKEAWIVSEDTNVEHLLNVFTTIDAGAEDVWISCTAFILLLLWHKPRLTVLGPKVEGLPDDHPCKPQCLFFVSRLFGVVGNYSETKRLNTQGLKLSLEGGDVSQVALMLRGLSDANRMLGLTKEGVEQAKETLEISERLGDTVLRAWSLMDLARLLRQDGQLDAAEEVASRATNLLPEVDNPWFVSHHNRLLGQIYQDKGNTEKAVDHFKIVLEIAPSLDWHDDLFWVHCCLAKLYFRQFKFEDADAHIVHAKSHAFTAYNLGRAMMLQATFWCIRYMPEEAKSEVLHAAAVFEKLGAATDLEMARKLLQQIDDNEKTLAALDPEKRRGFLQYVDSLNRPVVSN